MKLDGYILGEGEQPLDVIKDDGGFTSIFRSIAVVGDSLSSGEFEGTNAEGGKTYRDRYEYSWGQFLENDRQPRIQFLDRRNVGRLVLRFFCRRVRLLERG